MNQVDYLILGYGFTARHLENWIRDKEPAAILRSTSRRGGDHLSFNLLDSQTWSHLPHANTVFWTFPPEPLFKVEKFFEYYKDKVGQWVVVGSTSAFKTQQPDERVDESTPLDLSLPRVKGEAFLKNQGAIVVFSSGIYGPGRNPLDWIKKGYVGKSDKYVNMIHGVDLAQFLYQASQRGEKGAVYIASDNNPQRWVDVINQWEQSGLVSEVPEQSSRRTSKKIDNSESIRRLQVDLKFDNFAHAVSATDPE